MTKRIVTLPAQLRRTLTWDQGDLRDDHPAAGFTVDTGVQVYFCDPRSPWAAPAPMRTQMGSSAQYLPRGH